MVMLFFWLRDRIAKIKTKNMVFCPKLPLISLAVIVELKGSEPEWANPI